MIQRFVSNPFFIYMFSFLAVLLTYSLGWSLLYPPLGTELLIFFLATFLISIFFGLLVHALKRITFQQIPVSMYNGLMIFLFWGSYMLEFAYNGGVPLLMVLNGDSNYDYRLFGIPTFHVFLATLNCFYSVYIFHQWISNGGRKQLFYFILSITPMILIVSRGMLFIILTSCLFVYILSLKKIRLKIIILLALSVIFIFYLFGLMGNLRQAHETSSKYMLKISKATSSFRNSVIPKEYIWSYIYISSPLANLQNTINLTRVDELRWYNFVNYELLPDFLSKRIGEIVRIPKDDVPRIAHWLTVSTFYARSYYFLGWIGLVLMFLFFLLTTFFYLLLIRKSRPYYVTGLAILNTLIFYNTFDNMYAFTGLSFQLVYPLLLSHITLPNIKLPKFTLNPN